MFLLSRGKETHAVVMNRPVTTHQNNKEKVNTASASVNKSKGYASTLRVHCEYIGVYITTKGAFSSVAAAYNLQNHNGDG